MTDSEENSSCFSSDINAVDPADPPPPYEENPQYPGIAQPENQVGSQAVGKIASPRGCEPSRAIRFATLFAAARASPKPKAERTPTGICWICRRWATTPQGLVQGDSPIFVAGHRAERGRHKNRDSPLRWTAAIAMRIVWRSTNASPAAFSKSFARSSSRAPGKRSGGSWLTANRPPKWPMPCILSLPAVYKAKSRVLQRLRRELKSMLE